MKKWNAPEVTELNITATASGDHYAWFEGASVTITCVNGKYERTTNTFGPTTPTPTPTPSTGSGNTNTDNTEDDLLS